MSWADVKAIHGTDRVLLGPSASYQWVNDPKHLLFVLARYKHAARLIGQAERVLEVGCGEGIGARLLAEGRGYLGIDPDREALAIAAERLHPGCFWPTSVERLPDHKAYIFEAAVSLDVIEHIQPSQTTDFLRDIARHLTADGVCVVGTPNATAVAYQSAASRAGHVNLFTGDALRIAMLEQFRAVQMFGMNDEVLHTGFLPMCHYLIAVGIGLRS